jgi:mannose-6-phosphate isomerase-like protein (cupin superfamily)
MASPSDAVEFSTMHLPVDRDAVAPDGCDVRILLALPRGGLAHFQLEAGQVSAAVRHRSVEEIWFFLEGQGEMWRRHGESEDVAAVRPGDCLTIPVGTEFQFRSFGPGALQAVGVTMPPWPGTGEAVLVAGRWQPTVEPGPL